MRFIDCCNETVTRLLPRNYNTPTGYLPRDYSASTEHLTRDYSTPTGRLSANSLNTKFPPSMYLSRPTWGCHLLPVLPNENPP